MINSYLRTPEGQEILNQNITNMSNQIEVKFSPLEIVYDGNTIRLTSKQVQDALDSTIIQEIGIRLAGLNVTTP